MAIQLKSQHITNMYTPIELVTTGIQGVHIGGGAYVTDHGYLHGLADNDHPQYLMTSQSSLFVTGGSLGDYLGTGATESFVHTTETSNFIANSNSIAFALTDHTHSDFLTTAALSGHTHGSILIASESGTNILATSASDGLTLNVPNFLTTAYGAAIQGSGSYSQNTGTIQFVNSNGITFGLSNNGVMTASIPAVGGAQTGISYIDAAAGTITEGSVHIVNSNGISFGISSDSLTASYSTLVFSDSNNIEFGISNGTLTALAVLNQTLQSSNVHNVTLSGNTSGTLTEISSGTLTLAGGSNITLSQSGNKISNWCSWGW